MVTQKRFSGIGLALILCLIVMLSQPAVHANPANKSTTVGVKVQVYPAGVIPALSGEIALSQRQALRFIAGYNATDRRDFGKHDNEEGGGPGFGMAWRYFFRDAQSGWHLGVRTDVWFLKVDWRDDAANRSGKTDITVLQPTAQAGYTWLLHGNRLALSATAALGAEINIRTDGEAVGEGAILLLGIGVGYRF